MGSENLQRKRGWFAVSCQIVQNARVQSSALVGFPNSLSNPLLRVLFRSVLLLRGLSHTRDRGQRRHHVRYAPVLNGQ